MGEAFAAGHALDEFRRDTIARAFRMVVVLGGLCLPPALFIAWRRGTLVSQGLVYIAVYGLVLVLGRGPLLPIRARAGLLTAALVLSGVSAFLSHGFYSDARIVLFVAAVFSAVVLGVRWATGIAVFAGALVGLGGSGVLEVPLAPASDIEEPATVATVLLMFLTLGFIGVGPLGFVIGRFGDALAEEQRALERARRATRAAEEAARELEVGKGLLYAIVEHSPAVITIKAPDGKYQLVNAAFEEASRLPRDRVIGMTDREIVSDRALADRVMALDARVVETRAPVQGRVARGPDGNYVTVKFPVFGPKGELVGVGGISTDLRDLKERTSLLVESEARHRAVFEGISHALLVLTPEGAVEEVNAGASRLFGVPPDELRRRNVLDLLAGGERAAVEGVLSGLAEPRSFDVRLRRGDGSEFDAELTHAKLPTDGRRVLVVLHDVSAERALERKQRAVNVELEARVKERSRELESANRELEAFSYSVSHDLRAPLRHVAGYVGLLRDHAKGDLDAEALTHLDQVSSAADRMARLIEDLLRFARLGKAELRVTAVDLEAIARAVTAEVLGGAGDRRIDVEIGPLPRVLADPALIRQALVNLVSNAVKFTRNREIARVEIGCLGRDGESPGDALIFVKDDGVGFDMRYASGLFGVFHRLHPNSAFEGTGVGLAHVKRIVTRLGGRVWAESSPGAGATFFFTLKEAAP